VGAGSRYIPAIYYIDIAEEKAYASDRL